MDIQSKYLAFHGSIVLLVGMLCGYPFGIAILKKDEELIRAWKLAHSSLVLGGTLSLQSLVVCILFRWEQFSHPLLHIHSYLPDIFSSSLYFWSLFGGYVD